MAPKRIVKYTPQEIKRRSELAKSQSAIRPRDARGHYLPAEKRSLPIANLPLPITQLKFTFLLGFVVLCLIIIFYQLGRLEVLNRDIPTTRIGILRITNQTQPPKYLLLERSGRVLTLILPPGVDAALYQNRRILATGYINDLEGTLKVATKEDLEPAPAVVQSPL